MLSLEENPCLVVGGGTVALRKIEGLLSEGARVTVVAVEACPGVETLEQDDQIYLERRAYRPGEASGFCLVMAATDDKAVNREVSLDAKSCGIWVNVADEPALCTFYLPARMKRGALQIAIASEGAAPFAMRRLRQLFQKHFGPEWGEWIDSAQQFRKAVYEKKIDVADQTSLFDLFFEKTVSKDKLTARTPSAAEIDAWLSED
jgi:precorrin-2 dehydrogenase/sirohydrochlorin ferrochelatase